MIDYGETVDLHVHITQEEYADKSRICIKSQKGFQSTKEQFWLKLQGSKQLFDVEFGSNLLKIVSLHLLFLNKGNRKITSSIS